MTKHDSFREQTAGAVNALLALFALATVVYGVFDYNVYTQLIGLDDTGYRLMYLLFAVLALSSLEQFFRGAYDK